MNALKYGGTIFDHGQDRGQEQNTGLPHVDQEHDERSFNSWLHVIRRIGEGSS